MPPGALSASATSTSPFGRAWIQRGCFRPAAKALTWSPGAATGVCPAAHPFAVGIFSVGMLPWGFAGGIAGVLPKAGAFGPSCRCRKWIAPAPTSATTRAKMPDKLISVLDLGEHGRQQAPRGGHQPERPKSIVLIDIRIISRANRRRQLTGAGGDGR